jgi:hypothetical protein
VWEAGSGNEFYTLNGHKAAITSLSFRADSNVLASASEDGTVKLWDMNNGKQIKSFNAHPGGTLSVDFASDGRIVTAGRDLMVRLWKADGAKIRDLERAKDIALHAVFSQDGTRVISDDFSGMVRVSNVSDGKMLGALDVNPATLTERLADAKRRVPETEAAATRTANALTAMKTAAEKANAEVATADAAATAAMKALRDAKDRLAKAPPTSQPTTASTELATAVKKAEADLATASAAVEPAKAKAKTANEELAKAKSAADSAAQEAQNAKSSLANLKQAQANANIAAARREYEDLTARAARVAQAMITIDAASKTLAESPEHIAAAEQQQARAKQALAASLATNHLSQDALVALEGLAVRSNQLGSPLHRINSMNILLQSQVRAALASVDRSTGLVKQTSEVVAAADAALAKARADQQDAPKQIEQAKAIIAASLTDRIEAAKAKLDLLTAEQARLAGNQPTKSSQAASK